MRENCAARQHDALFSKHYGYKSDCAHTKQIKQKPNKNKTGLNILFCGFFNR